MKKLFFIIAFIIAFGSITNAQQETTTWKTKIVEKKDFATITVSSQTIDNATLPEKSEGSVFVQYKLGTPLQRFPAEFDGDRWMAFFQKNSSERIYKLIFTISEVNRDPEGKIIAETRLHSFGMMRSEVLSKKSSIVINASVDDDLDKFAKFSDTNSAEWLGLADNDADQSINPLAEFAYDPYSVSDRNGDGLLELQWDNAMGHWDPLNPSKTYEGWVGQIPGAGQIGERIMNFGGLWGMALVQRGYK